jgi:alginate O-acetyltransferase complex protein AlgI
MSYDALYFALFLAVVCVAFEILPWRGPVLLAASIVFYAVAGVRDSILAALVILANFYFQQRVIVERRWLVIGLAFNFAVLVFFKYRVFFATSTGLDLFTGDIVVPLGISFYVFQLSAFLVDLRRGVAQPFTSLPRFALFKLFFGQLIAGPIMRWRQFGPQVHALFEGKRTHRRFVGLALGLCLLGLVKKIVFADAVAPFADAIFRDGPADAATAWFGLWLFGFQIYFDFSGYSDIALGLGHLFGLRLAVNFRQPYLARSPQEFWQRWHITLSAWIRDYLYVPLGGRHGAYWRQAAVLIGVMALAGLWHGASWTFVVWGVGWGLLILLWRLIGGQLAKLGGGEWLLMLALAMLLWTFFRSPSIAVAASYLGVLFALTTGGSATMPDDGAHGVLILAGCASLLALHWLEAKLFSRRVLILIVRADGPFLRGLLAGLALWLVLMTKPLDNPFIYFRF